MSIAICSSCGERLSIPYEYKRAKIQCANCGVFCQIPADAERELPVALPANEGPEAAQPVYAPNSEPEPGAPLLSGTDEDDGKPYTVPADPAGRGRTNNSTPKPAPVPFNKTWESGMSLRGRIQAFAGLVGMNVFLLLCSAAAFDNFGAAFICLFIASLLLAFMVGTYDRIELNRNRKGQVRLTQTWRVAFWPTKSRPIRWSEFESIATNKSHETHMEEWLVVAVLLPYGVLPAILWWWFVVRPDHTNVYLCKDHGFLDTAIYRNLEAWRADGVAEVVAEITGLPYKKME